MIPAAALAALAAALYLPHAAHPPAAQRTALKTLPVGILALAAFLLVAPLPVTLALALSVIGDLALSREGTRAFLVGLCAFLLAHLAYIFAMGDPFGGFTAKPVAGAALVALALSAELWLIPHAGRLAWPVRAYIAALTLMGLAALAHGGPLVVAGASLFIFSDLVLSVRVFRLTGNDPRRAAASRLLWLAYTAGQILLFLGLAAPG